MEAEVECGGQRSTCGGEVVRCKTSRVGGKEKGRLDTRGVQRHKEVAAV